MHGLDDAGEEGFGDAVAIVRSPSQQQILQLIEGGHDRNLEAPENFHQHFEER